MIMLRLWYDLFLKHLRAENIYLYKSEGIYFHDAHPYRCSHSHTRAQIYRNVTVSLRYHITYSCRNSRCLYHFLRFLVKTPDFTLVFELSNQRATPEPHNNRSLNINKYFYTKFIENRFYQCYGFYNKIKI